MKNTNTSPRTEFKLLALDVRHPKYYKILRDFFEDEALTVEHALAEGDVRYWCIVFLPDEARVTTFRGHRDVESLADEVTWHLRHSWGAFSIYPRLNGSDRDYVNRVVDQVQSGMLAECVPMGSA